MSGEDEKPDAKRAESGKAGGAAPESPWTGLLKSAVGQLIPIVITGASLIGFVAFAGAVIVWTRLFAIEVPPDQAVKAVPRAELVATGSSILLLFGFFGVLTVVTTYLVDRDGRATPGMSRALMVLLAVEGATAIRTFDQSWDHRTTIAVVAFVSLTLVALLATFHESLAKYVDELEPRSNETQEPCRGAGPLRTETGEARASAGELGALAGLTVAALGLLAVLIFVSWGGWAEALVVVALLVAGAALLVALVFVGGKIAKSLWDELTARRKADKEERARQDAARRERERAAQRRLERCMEMEVPAAANEGACAEGLRERIARTLAAARGEQLEKRPLKSREELERDHEAACEELRRQARRARRRPHRLKITPIGIVLLGLLGGAAIVLPCVVIGSWWLAVPLGAAMVLGIGVWRIAVLSRLNFMWFGFATFISVPLFGTLTLMAHNVADPQVQPMALIRSTDGPGEAIQGIYVTEASDRVYFANVATEGCEDKVKQGSGRLLWVPKDEVVAMSIGPLQNVDDAGLSALEMAYALTPDVETPTGERVELGTTRPAAASEAEAAASEGKIPSGQAAGTLTVQHATAADGQAEEGSGGASGAKPEENGAGGPQEEAEVPGDHHRLESAGPAVRPDFGSGLRLVPSSAEPGDVVELRMSVPNADVDGFGPTPAGYNLRLNGVRLAVLRVPAVESDRAEYVKTVTGQVLPLQWFSKTKASRDGYVRLEKGAVLDVTDDDAEHPLGLKLAAPGKLAATRSDPQTGKPAPPLVTLPNGEVQQLQSVLLRRAWSPTRIKFRVPDDATSGVISVECGQLAGQPLLDVVHPPVARVSVRMRPGSEKVSFDSSRSVDEGRGPLLRRWTIAGQRMGDKPRVSTVLPPRLAPYTVRLSISDADGLSDSVELRLFRLPSPRFPLGSDKPLSRKNLGRVREAVRGAVGEERPVAIELDGHADSVGSDARNLALSFKRVESVRTRLLEPAKVVERLERKAQLAEEEAATGEAPEASESAPAQSSQRQDPRLVNEGAPIPLIVRAFGESCPIVHSPGPQPVNRRVEIFLLGPGATVASGKGCHPGRIRRTSW